MNNQQLVTRRENAIGKGAPLFYEEPIHIVRGEGAYLFDADGKRYIDMYNNVPCVGHANPNVATAMYTQLQKLNVHSRYLHEDILEYAEKIADLHASSIESVVFSCSGTEANEVAMTMARIATGGSAFICTNAAYHGNSGQVGKLTYVPLENNKRKNIYSIPYPQTFRPIVPELSEQELSLKYLQVLEDTITQIQADGIGFAGILFCPIFANEGLPEIPAGFMQAATQMVRDAGGLVIIDEVQSGFCRTGRWWGYEKVGVEPDIVTMGKPMGNGLPLSATASRKEIVEQYRSRTRYFNTFASSPLQAATGMAVLKEIKDRNILNQVGQIGEYLRNGLEGYLHRIDYIGDIRSQGLFVGIDWVVSKDDNTPNREGAVRVVNVMKAKGFLMSNAGEHGNVIKIRPPLVFQKEHADAFLEAFDSTMDEHFV
ncbi:MAG: aspartate aminotransferase family protein [Candidatus Azotimanducaceae bacterium]